jgi:hypothetical protein
VSLVVTTACWVWALQVAENVCPSNQWIIALISGVTMFSSSSDGGMSFAPGRRDGQLVALPKIYLGRDKEIAVRLSSAIPID